MGCPGSTSPCWGPVLLLGPWLALGAGHAVLGLALLLCHADPPAAVLPAARRAAAPRGRTAIAACLRDEDMAAVLPPLGRLLDGLPELGFELWLLSDTRNPAHVAAEDAAVAAFRAARADGARIHLRRRAANTGFKAGNVMEFLDAEGAAFDHVVCLDADSEMSAAAVLRLVGIMEADPRIGIVQQLIVGRPAASAFPRLFQFGMRAGMRVWATAQAWWQGPKGPYWGHNAILRVAAFRAHGRLAPLPDGSTILSHDQVEAIRLHEAGWGVWCWPDESGSMEGNPPALPEFMARDERWAAGNMQYLQLIRSPGWARCRAGSSCRRSTSSPRRRSGCCSSPSLWRRRRRAGWTPSRPGVWPASWRCSGWRSRRPGWPASCRYFCAATWRGATAGARACWRERRWRRRSACCWRRSRR
jgi:membrane glycosyltransferase